MTKKPIIYMLKGLPASGKTAFARGMVDSGIKRVSKDDLRAMIDFGEYSPEKEMFILDARNAIVARAVELGFDIVIDDTNLNPAHEEAIRNLAAIHGANVEVIEMDASVEECIKRDAERAVKVGEEVIRRMAEKYLHAEDSRL